MSTIDITPHEGEQRAIAIASFLAELRLAGHNGGIVFDDPVSSLDHNWRKRVADRLVDEATCRQVIVLTHDTTFLADLHDAIERQAVDHLILHLEWMNGRPGHVFVGNPWEHQSYKERLDALETTQRAMGKTWPLHPSASDRETMCRQYSLLRATIERVIETLVLGCVVERYRHNVRVGNLKQVRAFTSGDCKAFLQLHDKCCELVDAHDHSSAKNAPVPDAVQLGADIQTLKALTESIKTRQTMQSV